MAATKSPMGTRRQRLSMISKETPSFRKNPMQSPYAWLAGKRKEDAAEGLWRIHDGIYDLTNFVKNHPGGSFWLEVTKGTDITEAFETHHIRNVPESLLAKYKVKEADKPRNIKTTFYDDGFYRTLKRNVQAHLKSLDYTPAFYSKVIADLLVTAAFITIILATKFESIYLLLLSSLFLAWTAVAGHNFFHQKDNFRMNYHNLVLLSHREMRVTHGMSHHFFPNTEQDLELTLFEPYLDYTTFHRKKFRNRFLAFIYSPLVWAGITPVSTYVRIYNILVTKLRPFYWDDLVPFTVPIAMYLFASNDILFVAKYWLYIVLWSSTFYGFIGLTASHHHPDAYHDGDQMRESMDWGELQLDAIMDRSDIQGNHFMTLTHFGDHSMHHMFPALDHGVLPQLYPILFETIKQFNVQLQGCGWFEHIIGQYMTLSFIEPCTEDVTKKKKYGQGGLYKRIFEYAQDIAKKFSSLEQ